MGEGRVDRVVAMEGGGRKPHPNPLLGKERGPEAAVAAGGDAIENRTK